MLIEAPCVIVLTTDYDVYTTPQLETELSKCDAAANVVIDFSRVRYVDSTAIGAFIRMHKRRMRAGLPPVRFAAVAPALARVLKLVALDHVWPTYDNVAAAFASFTA